MCGVGSVRAELLGRSQMSWLSYLTRIASWMHPRWGFPGLQVF